MKFLEKDLEDIIFEADKEKLEERGLRITGELRRQVRIGNYGVADLISFNRFTHIDQDGTVNQSFAIKIYELKKDRVGSSALAQVIRYAKGVERYFNERFPSAWCNITCVLIGSEISDSVIYAPDILGCVDIYDYKYTIDGVLFDKKQGYYLRDEGFGLNVIPF